MTQLPTPAFDGLYGERILDHARHPRHCRRLPQAHIEADELNPLCGDRVRLQLQLVAAESTPPGGEVVQAVGAVTEGCAIIGASASMLAAALEHRPLEEAAALCVKFRAMMQARPARGNAGSGGPASRNAADGRTDAAGTLAALELALPEELRALSAVRRYPVRVKCALLPWVALEEGLAAYCRSRQPGT